MKTRVLAVAFVVVLGLLEAARADAGNSQTYCIPTYSVDSGGADLSSASYRLIGSTGQPEEGTRSSSATFGMRPGLWPPFLSGIVTSVVPDSGPSGLPSKLVLAAPIPNPFNPATTLRLDLPTSGPVSLTLYDVSGRRVVELVAGTLPAGHYEVPWSGRDATGRLVSSGVYLGVLRAAGEQRVQRLTLLK